MIVRRCVIGQSGGPTVAINATLAGVIQGALKYKYDKIYGMINGLSGLLEEKFVDLSSFDNTDKMDKLIHTPAMYLGSCRYKIPERDYSIKQKIIDILNKYEITDFFYIGGNDSMDSIKKLSEYAKSIDCPIHFIGIPKTIDNDLINTDYTPGYPSACRYVATSLLEIVFDSTIYPLKSVTVVEIMGRDAGWLTASAQLVNEVYPESIDLIYMPEDIFEENEFVKRVRRVLESKDHCMIAVSEGIRNAFGMRVSLDSGIQKDAFGHMSNNGCSSYLKKIISERLGVKVRAIQLSTLQRCASHLASTVDIDNSITIGNYAVKCALNNKTGIMISIARRGNEFILSYVAIQASANHVKLFPLKWIDIKNKKIKKEYIDYVVPLIYESGKIELPQYLKLRG